jgi:hypothetical protein
MAFRRCMNCLDFSLCLGHGDGNLCDLIEAG